jgi:intein-encoded DNA endonuclease-like protein
LEKVILGVVDIGIVHQKSTYGYGLVHSKNTIQRGGVIKWMKDAYDTYDIWKVLPLRELVVRSVMSVGWRLPIILTG